MQFTELNAELRDKTGTGPARKIRREGSVPAILYGCGLKNANLKVNEREIDKILRTKLGKNTLIRLSVKGGDEQKVLIKDYQGDVLTRRVTHVDFMVVREDQKVLVFVPLKIEGKAAGITQGGLLEVITREVELMCQVGRIPENIVVDVSGLNVGQNIHLADLKLPEGVVRAEKYNPTIAAVYVPKQEEVAVAAAPEAAAAVPATAQKAEGAAAGAAPGATPAAGAAAPAKDAKAAAKPDAKKK